jgi:hypothetical protein
MLALKFLLPKVKRFDELREKDFNQSKISTFTVCAGYVN